MINKEATKIVGWKPSPLTTRRCNINNEDKYDDYIDGLLTGYELKSFEDHLDNCHYCLARVVESLIIQKRVEESDLLTFEGQKKSLSTSLNHLENLCNENVQSDDFSFLLAAATDKNGGTGIAYGIAVDKESKTGAIVECSAWVSTEQYEEGSLELRGVEVESLTKNSQSISVSSPLELLAYQLNDLFRIIPALNYFHLGKREITVDINYVEGTGYLFEAQSLSIAILTSILNATTNSAEDAGTVYSGRIRKDGKILKIGEVDLKVKILKEKGISTIILPEENRNDIVTTTCINDTGISILHFDTIEQLLIHQKMFGNKKFQSETISRPTGGKKMERKNFKYLLTALCIIIISLILWDLYSYYFPDEKVDSDATITMQGGPITPQRTTEPPPEQAQAEPQPEQKPTEPPPEQTQIEPSPDKAQTEQSLVSASSNLNQLTQEEGVEVSQSLYHNFMDMHKGMFKEEIEEGMQTLIMQVKNRKGYLLKDIYPYLNMKLLIVCNSGEYYLKSVKRDYDAITKDLFEKLFSLMIPAEIGDHIEDINAFQKKMRNAGQGQRDVVNIYYSIPKEYYSYFQNKLVRIADWYKNAYSESCDTLIIQGISGRLTNKKGSEVGEGFFVPVKLFACGKSIGLPVSVIEQDPDAAFFLRNKIVSKIEN